MREPERCCRRLCTGTGIETINSDKTHSATTKNGIAVSLFDARYQGDQRLDSIDLILGGRRFTAAVLNLEMVFNKKAGPAILELKESTKKAPRRCSWDRSACRWPSRAAPCR